MIDVNTKQIIAEGLDKKTAELIVQAVNSHDALVAIGLKILSKLDSPVLSVTANDADELRSALSLVEGEQ